MIWDNRGVLHRAAPYDPTRRARCCAPRCSATSRSSSRLAAKRVHSPSLTRPGHYGNLIPKYENHVLVIEIVETE